MSIFKLLSFNKVEGDLSINQYYVRVFVFKKSLYNYERKDVCFYQGFSEILFFL